MDIREGGENLKLKSAVVEKVKSDALIVVDGRSRNELIIENIYPIGCSDSLIKIVMYGDPPRRRKLSSNSMSRTYQI